MDIIAAYREVGTYRGAAEICGTTHKTVKRIIEPREAAERPACRARSGRATTTRSCGRWSRRGCEKTAGRISAKRLLPEARAAGYARVGAQLPAPGRARRRRRGGASDSHRRPSSGGVVAG